MGHRILVVDDDADVLEVFRLLLRRKYEVTTMSDAEGLMSGGTTEPFDLAIFDHRIRKVFSTDLIPWLKNKPEWRSTHFVIHSGVPDLKAIAASCAADGFLPKPSSIDDILSYVSRALDKKPEQSGADKRVEGHF